MSLKTKMEKIIHHSYPNIAGVCVRKKDEVVYESYLNGSSPETTVHVFSVTKSIISALIGIAIDTGKIRSKGQKVLEFFPEYSIMEAEKTIQNVTIEALLTMTAPYKYKPECYKERDYAKYFASEDWVNASLDLLGGKKKTGEFLYTPLIGPDILSGIIKKATGQSVVDFANQHLFLPLGISGKENIFLKNKEEQLVFYEAKNVDGWVAGPNGVNPAGWGLGLCAMDMAKIGQLYLNGGRWENKQIISSDWILESTMEHSRSNFWKLSNGYLWWVIDEKEHIYAAMGDGGNIIYVNEKKGMVVSIASFYQLKAKDRIKLIREYIEPAFEDKY